MRTEIYKSIETLVNTLEELMKVIIQYPRKRAEATDVKEYQEDYRKKVTEYVSVLKYNSELIGKIDWIMFVKDLQESTIKQMDFMNSLKN